MKSCNYNSARNGEENGIKEEHTGLQFQIWGLISEMFFLKKKKKFFFYYHATYIYIYIYIYIHTHTLFYMYKYYTFLHIEEKLSI